MIRTMSLSLLAGTVLSFGATSVALADATSSANSDEIRALVADMLADAETRSSLLQSGGVAGHDGKFFLASPDGANRLNVSGQWQFRYTANFRDDDAGDDFEPGFSNRRTKLRFDGHVFNDFYYRVQLAFDREGGGAFLEDAYVGYEFDNGLRMQAGQFKLPFLREELVSSAKQLTADRSYANELHNQGRSQGIQLTWAAENWRIMGAFSDGFNSANTDFNSAMEADWGLTARFEFLGGGNWAQFDDFTSPRGSEGLAWLIGAAVNWQGGFGGSDATGTVGVDSDAGQAFSWTIDGSLEGDGWNVFGAFIGRHADADFNATIPGAVATSSVDEFAFVLQGGIYVTEDIEPFLRWDALLPDDVAGGGSDDMFNVLTVGANWYLHGHAAKFTFDLQWFIDEPADSNFGSLGLPANTGIGYLGSGMEDSEFVLRAQFQLLF